MQPHGDVKKVVSAEKNLTMGHIDEISNKAPVNTKNNMINQDEYFYSTKPKPDHLKEFHSQSCEQA